MLSHQPHGGSIREAGFPRGLIVFAATIVLLALVSMPAPCRGQVAGSMGIWPANTTAEVGTTVQYGAYVPINPNTVQWFVNGIRGGNATLGTISTNGLYTAPQTAPTNNVLTILVKSTPYPTSSASTPLTVTRKYPWLWSVSPASLQVGNYQISLNGANFTPDAVVQANGADLATTYISATALNASGLAASTGTVNFAVRLPGLGAVTGDVVSATVKLPTITVAVSPATATVPLGQTTAFTAKATGSSNSGVTWTVVGGSANGSVGSSGIYTAPPIMPASATVKVRATAAANTSVYAEASITLTQPPAVTVGVSPSTASVVLGGTRSFSATVGGSANTAVTWSVTGGAANGTVSSAGLYTAPAAMPGSATVTVRAASVANPLVSASATITLVPPPVVVTVTPNPTSVELGFACQFTAKVSGTTNQAVTWTVLGGAGNGTITSTGGYATPATMPASHTVVVQATPAASPASTATATITLTAPPDYSALLAAARIAEQTSFGPNDALLAQIQQLGLTNYLAQQFAIPATPIPLPADNSVGTLAQWQLHTFCTAPDQLRQRVGYALSQIIVVSANKNIYADAMLQWLNALNTHAFGNYRNLLRAVTESASMGMYLDLANSTTPSAGSGANENYARELMQLFTVGLEQLNLDGSQVLDGGGQPIPTYTQHDVAQLALALTGWVYAQPPGGNVYQWQGAPMVPNEANHDLGSKRVLGQVIPAGQNVTTDLESVLDILMNHPNTAPFVSTRLIRSLVTSNPSGAYIQRVAQVFRNTSGDLEATLTAIFTDPEARDDSAPVNGGRLKEPVLHTCGLLRALNGYWNNPNGELYLFDYLAQYPLTAPSVFSWWSPLYHLPNSPLFGPEFQVYTPSEATVRGDLFYYMITTPAAGDFTIDLTPYQAYGNDMPGLVELVSQKLLYGRMPGAMKQALVDAATPGYDAATRIQTVLYLTSLSGYFAVQY